MKTKHRTIEELLVYLENPIGSKEDGTVEEHLAECDKCISDLSFLDALRAGLKEFGQNSRRLVESGISAHLTNEEIPGYIKNVCNEDEKIKIVTHLAGCDKCSYDVMSVENILEQLKSEMTLGQKIITLSRFAIKHPVRTTSLKKEGNELIREAVKNCMAPFSLGRAFSYSFRGADVSGEGVGEEYRKMETDDFIIEIIQPAGKEANVVIGILAKGDLENAKVTICREKEESGIVSLVNRRAIINKKDIEAEAIKYIKIEKV